MAAADGPSAADDEGPTEVRSVREVSANSDRLVLGGGGGGGRPDYFGCIGADFCNQIFVGIRI